MSVSNVASGITTRHIADIERTCQKVNTFLFIRPSTAETMELIGQGYATKSMDIHDKSSNWGPMSGFVPCDPAFSKALTGSPNPHPHYHEHGDAKPVHLALTEMLATPGSNPKLELDPTKPSTATVRFVKAVGGGAGAKTKTFKLEKQGAEWAVYWLDGDRPVELYVWGYDTNSGVKPVTGDYDLWMVAPHVSRWSQHTQIMGVKDSHGESGATLFITWLLQRLNAECGRSDNHVFHHGAESQNYGFTQAIDRSLAMFTPAGTSEMVDVADLPVILADLQVAGYLVYWNKRYGEADPHLMGNAVNAGVSGGPAGTAIQSLLAEAGSVKSFGNDKANALVQKNLLGRGSEVPKIDEIQRFHKALTTAMQPAAASRETGTMQKLRVGTHIPKSVMDTITGDVEGLRLQQELQRAVVDLSEMDHGAQATASGGIRSTMVAPSPEKWKAWESKHRELFRRLEDKYGRAGTIPLRFERITGTRAYKTSELPSPEIPSAQVDKLLGPFADLFKNMFRA